MFNSQRKFIWPSIINAEYHEVVYLTQLQDTVSHFISLDGKNVKKVSWIKYFQKQNKIQVLSLVTKEKNIQTNKSNFASIKSFVCIGCMFKINWFLF